MKKIKAKSPKKSPPKSSKKPPKKGPDRSAKGRARRFDYTANHQKIQRFCLEYLRDNRTLPTLKEISAGVKLSEKTCSLHMDSYTLQAMKPTYRSYTPAVMEGLLSKARTGNPMAVKLWMFVVEGLNQHENQNQPADGPTALNDPASVAAMIAKMTPEQRRERLAQLRERQEDAAKPK